MNFHVTFRTFRQKGWWKLQDEWREWGGICLKPGDEFYEFTQVFRKIDGKENAFGKGHRKNNCRLNFSKKSLLEGLRTKTSTEVCNQFQSPKSPITSPVPPYHTRYVTRNTTKCERICFICNVVHPCDGNKYRGGTSYVRSRKCWRTFEGSSQSY